MFIQKVPAAKSFGKRYRDESPSFFSEHSEEDEESPLAHLRPEEEVRFLNGVSDALVRSLLGAYRPPKAPKKIAPPALSGQTNFLLATEKSDEAERRAAANRVRAYARMSE